MTSIIRPIVFGVFLLGFLLIAPSGAIAQSDFELRGYVDYQTTYTDNQLTPGTDLDHLLQSRLNSSWYVTDSLTAVCEIRFRGYYGDSVSNNPYFIDQITGSYNDPKLDVELWNTNDSYGYGQVDRLYVDYFADPIQVTLGRQRVTWGTTLVWNVIDVFNTASTLDLSYEEGVAIDAIRTQLYTGAVSKIELVVKPGSDEFDRTMAGLWNINAGSYDFYFIAGQRDNRLVLGGAWAGSVIDAGFRGELMITEAPGKGKPSSYPVSSAFGESLYEGDDHIASVALSADYTFENSFYIHSEILYNSNGKTENAGMFTYQALEAGMLSSARLSFFQEFSYNFAALWRGSLFAILNVDDSSWVMVPSLTWSTLDNLDMTFTGYVADGEPTAEYGVVKNTLVYKVKYSF